jgi:CHAT domain-containing protein/tetratricopeptide (TPR) repeat protein
MQVFLRAGAVLGTGVCLTFADAAAQRAHPRTLIPGAPVTSGRSGDQPHAYEIHLEAGQFTMVTVKQKHARPRVSITAPSGDKLFELFAETVGIFAEATGRYGVQILAFAGDYEIRIEPPRVAGAQDKARAAGDRALSDGRRLALEASTTSTRAAIESFKRARAQFRDAGYTQGEGLALTWIGDAYVLLEERTPARDAVNEGLALARATHDQWLEAEALLSLGASYPNRAEQPLALQYYEQALAFYEAVDDRRGQAAALWWVGVARNGMREYHAALKNFEMALSLADAAGDVRQTAKINNSFGVTYRNLGDLPRALEFHTRAVEISRVGGALRSEYTALNNAGIDYKELGDYRRALDAYNQSLALVRKLGTPFGEAMVLNNIGNIYKAENQNETALEYFTQALQIFRRFEYREGEAIALNNIGSAYSQMGQYQTALTYHEQSREIRKAIGDRTGEASSLHHAGLAWRNAGDLDKAIERLRESLEIRREVNDPVGEADTLMVIASVERDRGKPEESRATIEAALTITEALRARIQDAGLRASYIARVQETYASYVDVLMRLHEKTPSAGYDAAALQAAERTRARVLLESLVEMRADLHQGVDAALLERERSSQKKLDAGSERLSRALSRKSAANEIAAARTELDGLTSEYQQVQAQIRKSSPRYAALTQPEPLSAAAIQQNVLDDDTVLLEFALGEKSSWLWAVTPQTITSVALPSQRDLEAAARSLYGAVTARQPRQGEAMAGYSARVAAADRQLDDRAAVMSRMLFGGIAEQLRGPWSGKRLVIVAAGALEYLPFASLPLPGTTDGSTRDRAVVPLIARHEIVEAPSASVLATLRREAIDRQPARRPVAVLADPVFDAGDPRVTGSKPVATDWSPTRAAVPSGSKAEMSYLASRAVARLEDADGRAGLARLPFSRDEANAIGLLAGRNTLQATDFRANRSTVLGSALEDYRIVHFATHGLIDAERPELSGLILSLVNDRGAPQDGLLRLHDIFNMKLNADLVVLSACQTALGKEINGEGLVGLTRGFMYAGAPRVVASLWQVSDVATAELMKRFYTGMLQKRLPAAAALRRAQLELAKDPRWASPYFWAGFVLQGDWR